MFIRRTGEILARQKVLGITVHSGIRRGYIRYEENPGLKTKRVEQLGKKAWSTIDIIDEVRNRNELVARGE